MTLQFGKRRDFSPHSHRTSNQICKAPKNHRISGRLKAIIAKMSPTADGVFFSQNAPCELTRPWAHFQRGLTINFGNEVIFDPIVIVTNQISKAPNIQSTSRHLKGIIAKLVPTRMEFFLWKRFLRLDASMGTLWERFDSSIWERNIFLTPLASCKQSHF